METIFIDLLQQNIFRLDTSASVLLFLSFFRFLLPFHLLPPFTFSPSLASTLTLPLSSFLFPLTNHHHHHSLSFPGIVGIIIILAAPMMFLFCSFLSPSTCLLPSFLFSTSLLRSSYAFRFPSIFHTRVEIDV